MSQTPSFFRASGRVAFATLLTRIAGMARDITVAHLFGASAALDAFFVAFKIPNFLRRLFAEGAFAQGLVPMLTHSEHPRELFQSLLAGVILLGGLVTIFAEWTAPLWVHVFAPGFNHEPSQFALTVYLFRITFPFLFFVLITALFSAALNVKYCFGWPALAPIWLNVATLLSAWFLTTHLMIPISALAWGIVSGGLLQVVFLLPLLRRMGWPLLPKLSTKMAEVWHVMVNTTPGVIGVSIGQLGLVVDVILASYLPSGSISWLFYSDRLVSMPLGLIGVAVSSAILPYLSHFQIENCPQAYQRTLDAGLRLILLLGFPAAIGLIMLSGPITATVFQSGHFTVFDVEQAHTCLAAFAYGLPGLMIIKVFVSAINARERFAIPCVVALFSLLLNVILGLFLMRRFAHVGLAYATTAAVWLNAILIGAYSLKQLGLAWMLTWRRFMLQLLTALTVMIIWLWWWSKPLTFWMSLSYVVRWGHLLTLIFSAILAYVITLFIVGMRKGNIKL
jgi:putative peptidoglycan lipid II flippase